MTPFFQAGAQSCIIRNMPRVFSMARPSLASPLARYGAAVLATSLALVVTHHLMALSSRATLLLLLWAVMVSAWYGGPGPGLSALVLGVVGAEYFLLEPVLRFGVTDPSDNVRLVFFAGASLAVVTLVWRQRRTQVHLARQNEALEREVIERQRTQKELEHAHEQLQALAARMTSVREEERARIAREVHDVLGQMLMVVRLEAARLANKLEGHQEQLRHRAESIIDHVDDLAQIVQRISTELQPHLLDNAGLTAAIEWEVGEFSKRLGLKANMQLASVKPTTLSNDRGLALFRVLQEALTNVARHADATEIQVTLTEDGGRLILMVRDNGRGIREQEMSDPGSLGLLGMSERVRPFGGTVTITGEPGRGTTLVATIATP